MTGASDARNAIADEYRALADLLEAAGAGVWDAPSLCERWRTREVVAHVTMPARYDGPAFMAELEAAGGDFTRLSDVIAARDGVLPADTLLHDLRSPVLHGWEPPGGGSAGALTHCVIHALDVEEAVTLPRRVPDASIRSVLALVAAEFPTVSEGRGYTQGRLLRERWGFAGELRARGAVRLDHVFLLARCGFNSFELPESELEGAAAALLTFSAAYQSSNDRGLR